jgi:flagellar biogenesis protein FliO
MQVIERLPLTPQHSLHLIRIDDRLIVVASGPGGCSLLEEKPL